MVVLDFGTVVFLGCCVLVVAVALDFDFPGEDREDHCPAPTFFGFLPEEVAPVGRLFSWFVRQIYTFMIYILFM